MREFATRCLFHPCQVADNFHQSQRNRFAKWAVVAVCHLQPSRLTPTPDPHWAALCDPGGFGLVLKAKQCEHVGAVQQLARRLLCSLCGLVESLLGICNQPRRLVSLVPIAIVRACLHVKKWLGLDYNLLLVFRSYIQSVTQFKIYIETYSNKARPL